MVLLIEMAIIRAASRLVRIWDCAGALIMNSAFIPLLRMEVVKIK